MTSWKKKFTEINVLVPGIKPTIFNTWEKKNPKLCLLTFLYMTLIHKYQATKEILGCEYKLNSDAMEV